MEYIQHYRQKYSSEAWRPTEAEKMRLAVMEMNVKCSLFVRATLKECLTNECPGVLWNGRPRKKKKDDREKVRISHKKCNEPTRHD